MANTNDVQADLLGQPLEVRVEAERVKYKTAEREIKGLLASGKLTKEQARHRLVNARCTLVWLVELWLEELRNGH